MTLRPTDVFTPNEIPVYENNVYTVRVQAEADFVKAMSRNEVPLVYGEYGVGKTSLVRKQFFEQEVQKKLINIENSSGKSFSDVLKRILEVVGYTIEKSSTTTDKSTNTEKMTGTISGGFEAIKAVFTAEKSKSSESQLTAVRELLVTSPTDSRVIEIAEQNSLRLIVDELHRADLQFISDLTAFLKTFSNKGCKNFRIALLGTATDPTKLVQIDPGIDRLIIEIGVKSLSPKEARFIVKEGMKKLEISISNDLIEKIVTKTAGSPFLVQYVSLEIAENCFAKTPKEATNDDLDEAIATYVRVKGQRLNDLYKKAIETTGIKRYRSQILRAMAEIDDDYITMDQIRAKVSQNMGTPVLNSTLSGPLRALKTKAFGNILKDVERSTGAGDRVYNYSTFSDPTMKAFIRMVFKS